LWFLSSSGTGTRTVCPCGGAAHRPPFQHPARQGRRRGRWEPGLDATGDKRVRFLRWCPHGMFHAMLRSVWHGVPVGGRWFAREGHSTAKFGQQDSQVRDNRMGGIPRLDNIPDYLLGKPLPRCSGDLGVVLQAIQLIAVDAHVASALAQDRQEEVEGNQCHFPSNHSLALSGPPFLAALKKRNFCGSQEEEEFLRLSRRGIPPPLPRR
jgi:hypothetical protein